MSYTVGIDFGSKNCVVCKSKVQTQDLGQQDEQQQQQQQQQQTPSTIVPELIQNSHSNNHSPNIVSFRENERLFAEEASSQFASRPQNSVIQLATLLGLKNSTDVDKLQREKEFITAKLVPSGINEDLVAFEVQYKGEKVQFTPEQCTAMILRKLVSFGFSNTEDIKSITLAIPDSYTSAQKQALLDAVKISGVMRHTANFTESVKLIPVNVANALFYASRNLNTLQPSTTKDTEKNVESTPEAPQRQNVCFVDFGHSHLSVSLVSFENGNIRVLASKSTSDLGGRNFDLLLANYFAEEMLKQKKVDVTKSIKPKTKLMQVCEKTKCILSTIQDTNFEYETILEGDVDFYFSQKISRAKFEDMCRDLISRVGDACKQVLTESNLKQEDIERVELIGGSCRIPAVQSLLRDIFDKNLSTSLNGTYSVALGSALYGVYQEPVLPEGVVKFSVQSGDETPIQNEGFDEATIKTFSELEEVMSAHDAQITLRNEKKNEVETYIYHMRDQAETNEHIRKVLSAQEATTLNEILDSTQDWLHDNHDHDDHLVFSTKLEQLKDEIDSKLPQIKKVITEQAEIEKKKAEEAAAAALTAEKKPKEPRSNAERLKFAQKRKEQGNTLFKEGGYDEAASRYILGLSYLDQMYNPSEEEVKQVNEIKVSCHLNVSACFLKLEKHKKVIENCTKVVEIDGNNTKAFFRRGQAHHLLGDLETASKDLNMAKNLAPNDSAVKVELQKVTLKIEQQKKKEKQMYSKMFA